ncbi:hypothetical protein GTQ40_17240 [Flavobacteriaceae bacterium R38]|nr:hypothetical protein [Flavobacteriaceae bacterium R38]
MKKLFFLSIILTISNHIIQAQKVNDYTIDVHFFPKDAQMWGYPVSSKSFMRGSTRVEFSNQNIDTISFYLHGELKVDSISSGQSVIKYKSEKVFYEYDYSNIGLKTTIDFPDEIHEKTLTIYYSGFMNPSRTRSLSDYMRINQTEGVFLRGHYYSPWFPIFQRPYEDDYEVNFKKITVKLPSKFKAVVTGKLLSETIEDEIYTAEWMPGKNKMSKIQCTARPYEIISRDNISVYYTNDRQSGEKIIDNTLKLKKLFYSNLRSIQNDTSSLYIVEMPEYGNISSQNVIGISTNLYKNLSTDLHSRLTIAHELVHPYVSIPVLKKNPFNALVVEGFPSFFHLYGLKKITKYNQDFDLKKYMKKVEKNYIKKKRTGEDGRGNLLPFEKPILKISFSEIGLYKDVFILSDRVKLFLYHLWNEMGDIKYDKFLKELFQLNSINYKKFETLVVKYAPNYKNSLYIWLNTIEYPKSLHIGEL